MKIYTKTENGIKKYKAVNQRINGRNVFYTPSSLGVDKKYAKQLYPLQKVGAIKFANGYAWNFSKYNYAKTLNNFAANNMLDYNYEFACKITPTAYNGNECYAIKYYNGIVVKGVGINNDKISWGLGYPFVSGYAGDRKIESTWDVSYGTTYWLRGIIKNKIAYFYYSLDGQTYNLVGTLDLTGQPFAITNSFYFGATPNDTYGTFNGVIDFNETYIKINDTYIFRGDMLNGVKDFGILSNNYIIEKGPIDYTVAGNPTINNGIVSNFSYTENNKSYIKIEKMFFSPNIKAEYILRFKLDSNKVAISNKYMNLAYWPVMIWTYIGNTVGTSQNFYAELAGVSGNLSLGSIPINTFYSVKIACDGAGMLTSYNSQDGQTWTQIATKDITGVSETLNMDWHLGYRADTGGFAGEIDINNSCVKRDGWAYFSGANLVWANKNIYLESDAKNGKRITANVIINATTDEFEINFFPTSPTSQGTAVNEGPLSGKDTDNYLYTFSRWYTAFNGTYWSLAWYNVGIKHNISYKNSALYFNNTVTTRTNNYSSGYNNLTLFCSANGYFEGKIYNYFCKRNGKPLIYLVPVSQGLKIGNFIVPSNGMFDIVEQKFYPNAGTGNFIYGKD